MKGVIYNESPEERTERFMMLVEADERRRLKEEYEAERRRMNQEIRKNEGKDVHFKADSGQTAV